MKILGNDHDNESCCGMQGKLQIGSEYMPENLSDERLKTHEKEPTQTSRR